MIITEEASELIARLDNTDGRSMREEVAQAALDAAYRRGVVDALNKAISAEAQEDATVQHAQAINRRAMEFGKELARERSSHEERERSLLCQIETLLKQNNELKAEVAEATKRNSPVDHIVEIDARLCRLLSALCSEPALRIDYTKLL